VKQINHSWFFFFQKIWYSVWESGSAETKKEWKMGKNDYIEMKILETNGDQMVLKQLLWSSGIQNKLPKITVYPLYKKFNPIGSFPFVNWANSTNQMCF
jgi:hypothetical protein